MKILPARISRTVRTAAVIGATGAAVMATAAYAAVPTTSVTLVGSMQSEAGCAFDWQPDCAATHLAYSSDDLMWHGTFTLPPPGNVGDPYRYKVALNDSWDTYYGLHAGPDDIPLPVAATGAVRFYFDPATHWVTSDHTSAIPVAVGTFQSELGCPSDWAPGCLRSLLEDVDGDGVHTRTTTAIPAGAYQLKVAMNESWDVNYGPNGTRDGADIPFTVKKTGDAVSFTYRASTHVLTVQTGGVVFPPPVVATTPKPTTPVPATTPVPPVVVAPTTPAPPATVVLDAGASTPTPAATTPRPQPALSAVAKAKQTDARLAGVVVGVAGVPAGVKVTATILRGATKVGAGSKTSKGGTTSFRVALNARGRKLVRHKSMVKLTVRYVVAGAGAPAPSPQQITLRRR